MNLTALEIRLNMTEHGESTRTHEQEKKREENRRKDKRGEEKSGLKKREYSAAAENAGQMNVVYLNMCGCRV